jgi:hypothetical protein
MEVAMQKWPYLDLGYLNVEHIRFMPQKNDPAQKWGYLTVEAVFVPVSENAAMFFDHYKFSRMGSKVGIIGAISLALDYLFVVENNIHLVPKSKEVVSTYH